MTLSTQNSDTTTWQSNSDLTRSQAALISSHWSEITRHLAPPGIAWRWSECGLSHRLKTVLKDRDGGLIHRSTDGDRWETSMRLWRHVIDCAGDDETIGTEAQGQQVLADAPTEQSGKSRSLHTNTSTPRGIDRDCQSTLNGDVIEDNESREIDTEEIRKEIRRPWRKDPTSSKPTPKELAANHPSQARLAAWVGGDGIDRWDVDTSRTEGVVSQSEGRVYYPVASSASPGGQARLPAFTAGQWNVTIPG